MRRRQRWVKRTSRRPATRVLCQLTLTPAEWSRMLASLSFSPVSFASSVMYWRDLLLDGSGEYKSGN